MNGMHVSMSYKGEPFSFDLIEGKRADNSVFINGNSYEIHSDQKQMPLVKEVLNALDMGTFKSLSDFEGRISRLQEVKNVSVKPGIHQIGIGILGKKSAPSDWKEKQNILLPKKMEMLAEAIWNKKHIEEKTKNYLGNEDLAHAIAHAMQASDSEKLAEIFKECKLTPHEIWDIYNVESLPYPLSVPKSESYEITQEDRAQLKKYLTNANFSGVVRISDHKSAYTITPNGQEENEMAFFPMHSVGKVFTGTVTLLTMPETSFNEPIVLSSKAFEKLPVAVRNRLILHPPTLHQAMTHRAGLGDYLGNYEKAIKAALQSGAPLPKIRSAGDFLKYANEWFYPLGEGHYSNLGILLVALAVQNYKGMTYENILQKVLLDKEQISMSTTKPINAKYNDQDPCNGLVMGGPAGGYWTGAQDLHKLGTFLQKQCLEDPKFLSKMERFGQEFYISEDREIRHNGCSDSGSAILSSFLDSGVTLTILSDQGNFMADKIYHTIRENIMDAQ